MERVAGTPAAAWMEGKTTRDEQRGDAAIVGAGWAQALHRSEALSWNSIPASVCVRWYANYAGCDAHAGRSVACAQPTATAALQVRARSNSRLQLADHGRARELRCRSP
ncbi:hypothetical protein [Xanthomonas melonis]|uniref:hypothetical protein n=1 Tax=Xanthomonas melonis TaxID=56456 RepID=UPI0011B078DD|nr:hypothetical protein [Xanthomonas melonis]